MSTSRARIGTPIVVHTEAAPGPAPRRGRAQKHAAVYEAILAMQPGQWFRVPDPSGQLGANARARGLAVSAIRKWLAAQAIEGVEVYQTIDREVIVRCGGTT